MTEVSIDQFATATTEGAFVIDVREPEEYEEGHVAGARLIPLGEVPVEADGLPTDLHVYVICASGNRSLRAAEYLRESGREAYSVTGGTSAWIRAGRSVVTGPSLEA